MNAATEPVDSRWLTADSSTTTTTTDSTSSAASTLPSSANPLWSQPLAADGTRSASLMPKMSAAPKIAPRNWPIQSLTASRA